MKEIIEEIRSEIEQNKLDSLSKFSHLTIRQIEIYLLWRKMREYNIKNIKEIKTAYGDKISIWTLYKILRQFRENVKKTIFDLIILDILNVVSLLDISSLRQLREHITSMLISEEQISKLLNSALHKRKL